MFLIMQAFQILNIIINKVMFNSFLVIVEVDLILFHVLQRIINVPIVTRGSLILHGDDVLIHLSLRDITGGRVLIDQIKVSIFLDLKRASQITR